MPLFSFCWAHDVHFYLKLFRFYPRHAPCKVSCPRDAQRLYPQVHKKLEDQKAPLNQALLHLLSFVGGFHTKSSHFKTWKSFKVQTLVRYVSLHGTDLPLIRILSVYTDFLTVKFGKIQIFLPKIR